MKNLKITVISFATGTALLAGCSNMSAREEGTAKGAGIGALGGAVLGGLIGGKDGAVKGAVVGSVAGAVGGNLWSKRMEEKQAAMQKATAGTGIDVVRTADNQLKLNVPSDASFDVGRFALKPGMRGVLDQFSAGLQSDSHTLITVVGHTDSTGSDAVNEPLSVSRAASVRDYLAAKGVPAQRVSVSGRGAKEPVADNASAEGRGKNRRVEIFLREPEQAQAQTAAAAKS
jgi:outer membrane protein OmpA-like peptidoglycan-associated protein